MSREPVAWVFNLDAEDELLRGKGPHTPSLATHARATQLLPLLGALMAPGDEVLWPLHSAVLPKPTRGRAWCPTTWAKAQMARAGLKVPPSPSPAILREVNHRRFAHQLGQALPGARFVLEERELGRVLCDSAELERVSCERNWLLKRPLGYAGRGRRKIGTGTWSAADRTWIGAALRSGEGLQVEPMVTRELDCAIHGWLGADGNVTLGEPTQLTIDSAGTWVSSVRGAALTDGERAALEQTARDTAEALTLAGYFGPFGLDAFRWRAPDGTLHFQPRCELNARYSMGWAIGMGAVDLPERSGE